MSSRFAHRFPPNSGRLVGYLGLSTVVAMVALSYPTMSLRGWVTLSLAGVVVGAGIWVILLRPRAFATDEHLVLWNMVSDTWIPLAAIERVEPKYALLVWANGKKHHCVGITKSRRAATASLRSRGRAGIGSRGYLARAGWSQPQGSLPKVTYENFVAEQIERLADDARASGLQPGPVRRSLAMVEIGMLVVPLAAFAALLVL